MGAQLIKEVAAKTNDVAGDGTTTATVLAQAMVNEGMKNLAAGANPIVLRKGMKKATDKAVQMPCRDEPAGKQAKSRLQKLQLFLPEDEEVGQMVADAMEKVSKDGVITIEESKTMQTRAGPGRRYAVRPWLYLRLHVHRYGENGSSSR